MFENILLILMCQIVNLYLRGIFLLAVTMQFILYTEIFGWKNMQ